MSKLAFIATRMVLQHLRQDHRGQAPITSLINITLPSSAEHAPSGVWFRSAAAYEFSPDPLITRMGAWQPEPRMASAATLVPALRIGGQGAWR